MLKSSKTLDMTPIGMVFLNVAMYLSMLMKKYSKEIISVNPPNLMVSLLNGIGKMRGLKI